MFKRIAFLITTLFLLFVTTTAFAFKLPDTGQTKCYRGVSPYDEIPCVGTGQDGAYDINSMSFTVIGSNNDMVQDNNTGLIWQRQDDGNTYNWYQASGTYDATYNPSSQDVCGELTTGSYSDWRLPTKKELITIVDYAIPYPGPTINMTYFPNTKSSSYLSSTEYVYGMDGAWHVHFNGGYVNRSFKASYMHVRCVRGGQSSPSFTDNGNGTVTDSRTGLVWQQGASGYMTWDSALSYCEGLSLGGNTDWRLPNIKELESITDNTRYYPAIDTSFFPNSIGYSWSSTTNADLPDFAWFVEFLEGGVESFDTGYDKNTIISVRCVRGEQTEQPPTYGNLEISPSSLDFGELFVGDCLPKLFILKNTGNADLVISDISLSDTTNFQITQFMYDCSSGQTITPGDICNVLVNFCPSTSGTFNANLTVTSNDLDSPTAATMTGAALSDGSSILITKYAQKSQINSGAQAIFDITIENNGETPLVSIEVKDDQCDELKADKKNNNIYLAIGDKLKYTCIKKYVTRDLTNIAAVKAVSINGNVVTSSATATVKVDNGAQCDPTLYENICDKKGQVVTGFYILSKKESKKLNCNYGGYPDIVVLDRQVMPNGDIKCIEQGIVGGDDCLGRCGAGCSWNLPGEPERYTQECFNHDLCARSTGSWLGPCKTEFDIAQEGWTCAEECPE